MQAPSLQPSCPRCGYDLAGLVATWTQVIPLESTCSECGLLFRSANVLSPKLIGPPWSFEHAPRHLVRRWIHTSFVALRTKTLFTDLLIDHRIVVRRLVWFILCCLLLLHALVALANISLLSVAALNRWGTGWSAAVVPEVVRSLINPYTQRLSIPVASRSWTIFYWWPLFLIVLAPTFLMPVWMTLLGTTFHRANVRRSHLLRGLAYTMPSAAIFIAFLGVLLITRWGPPLVLPGIVVFLLYHTRWWSRFIKRYLHLRHALATAILMQIMSVLALTIIGTLAG